jgi:putative addiction module component (TIGR02574 family)
MSETAERLKSALDTLSPGDRAALAHYLIASLDEGEDEGAKAAWDAELARRAENVKSGTAVGIPAVQVHDELRRKYS